MSSEDLSDYLSNLLKHIDNLSEASQKKCEILSSKSYGGNIFDRCRDIKKLITKIRKNYTVFEENLVEQACRHNVDLDQVEADTLNISLSSGHSKGIGELQTGLTISLNVGGIVKNQNIPVLKCEDFGEFWSDLMRFIEDYGNSKRLKGIEGQISGVVERSDAGCTVEKDIQDPILKQLHDIFGSESESEQDDMLIKKETDEIRHVEGQELPNQNSDISIPETSKNSEDIQLSGETCEVEENTKLEKNTEEPVISQEIENEVLSAVEISESLKENFSEIVNEVFNSSKTQLEKCEKLDSHNDSSDSGMSVEGILNAIEDVMTIEYSQDDSFSVSKNDSKVEQSQEEVEKVEKLSPTEISASLRESFVEIVNEEFHSNAEPASEKEGKLEKLSIDDEQVAAPVSNDGEIEKREKPAKVSGDKGNIEENSDSNVEKTTKVQSPSSSANVDSEVTQESLLIQQLDAFIESCEGDGESTDSQNLIIDEVGTGDSPEDSQTQNTITQDHSVSPKNTLSTEMEESTQTCDEKIVSKNVKDSTIKDIESKDNVVEKISAIKDSVEPEENTVNQREKECIATCDDKIVSKHVEDSTITDIDSKDDAVEEIPATKDAVEPEENTVNQLEKECIRTCDEKILSKNVEDSAIIDIESEDDVEEENSVTKDSVEPKENTVNQQEKECIGTCDNKIVSKNVEDSTVINIESDDDVEEENHATKDSVELEENTVNQRVKDCSVTCDDGIVSTDSQEEIKIDEKTKDTAENLEEENSTKVSDASEENTLKQHIKDPSQICDETIQAYTVHEDVIIDKASEEEIHTTENSEMSQENPLNQQIEDCTPVSDHNIEPTKSKEKIIEDIELESSTQSVDEEISTPEETEEHPISVDSEDEATQTLEQNIESSTSDEVPVVETVEDTEKKTEFFSVLGLGKTDNYDKTRKMRDELMDILVEVACKEGSESELSESEMKGVGSNDSNSEEEKDREYTDKDVANALKYLEDSDWISDVESVKSCRTESLFSSDNNDKKEEPAKRITRSSERKKPNKTVNEFKPKQCVVKLLRMNFEKYSKCAKESTDIPDEEISNEKFDKSKFVSKDCYVKLEPLKFLQVSSDSEFDTSSNDEDAEINRLCNLSSLSRKRPVTSDDSSGNKKVKRHKRIKRKRKKINSSGSETADLTGFSSVSEDDITKSQRGGIFNEELENKEEVVDPNRLLTEIVCHTIHDSDSDSSFYDSDLNSEVKVKKKPKEEPKDVKNEKKKQDDGDKESSWKDDPLLRGDLRLCKENVKKESTENKKKRKSKNDSGDDSADSNRNSKRRMKKIRKLDPDWGTDSDSKKSASSSSSGDEFCETVAPSSKSKTTVMSEDSDIELVEADANSPSKSSVINVDSDEDREKKPGRRNILSVLSNEKLTQETQMAAREEADRVKRLEKRNQLRNTQSQVDLQDSIVLDTTKDGYKITVDPLLSKRMFPHQVEGVKFMWDACYESVDTLKSFEGTGCILAHNMGLGKTFQVVTLVHTLFTHTITNTNHVLIVCPLSTVSGWRKEFRSGLKEAALNMDISITNIESSDDFDTKCGRIRKWKQLGGVLIVGYEAFEKLTNPKRNNNSKGEMLRKALVNPGPDLVVCDEGHLLKNGKALRTKALMAIKTRRRIALTGTPLQNNLTEYYHMVQFVKPNLLGTKHEFNRQFANPIINGQYEDSDEADIKLMKQRTHVLHRLLKNTVQRYEAKELKTYLKTMTDVTLFIQLHPLQEKLYRSFIEKTQARMANNDGKQKLKKFFSDYPVTKYICSHPQLLYTMEAQNAQRKKKAIKETDVISEEPEVQEVDGIPNGWWKSDCPEEVKTNVEFGTKLQVMMAIIEEAEKINEKVLIFTNSLVELSSIEYFLKLKGTPNCPSWRPQRDYFRMDGTVLPYLRTRMCELFNDKKNKTLRVFMMSHKVGGLGLNLVAANRVILLGANFNPSYDSQSIYRAYRFGQDKPVYIYRLLSMGTMEEKIYNRGVNKLAIASRVVDKHQIARHYKNLCLDDLYTVNIDLSLERSTPAKPDDDLLSKILLKFDCIYKYHHHQKLLENQPNEELNEEDKMRAWEEFKQMSEKKTIPEPGMSLPRLNPMSPAVSNVLKARWNQLNPAGLPMLPVPTAQAFGTSSNMTSYLDGPSTSAGYTDLRIPQQSALNAQMQNFQQYFPRLGNLLLDTNPTTAPIDRGNVNLLPNPFHFYNNSNANHTSDIIGNSNNMQVNPMTSNVIQQNASSIGPKENNPMVPNLNSTSNNNTTVPNVNSTIVPNINNTVNEISTIGSNRNSTTSADINNTVGSKINNTIEPNKNSTIDPNINNTVGFNQNSTIGSNKNCTIGSNKHDTSGSNKNSTIGSDINNTVGSNKNSSIGSNKNSTIGSDKNSTIGSNKNNTSGSNKNSTNSPNINNTVGSNKNSTIGFNKNSTIGSNKNNTSVSNKNSTNSPNISNTVGSNKNSTVGSKINSTIGSNKKSFIPKQKSSAIGPNPMVLAKLNEKKENVATKRDGKIWKKTSSDDFQKPTSWKQSVNAQPKRNTEPNILSVLPQFSNLKGPVPLNGAKGTTSSNLSSSNKPATPKPSSKNVVSLIDDDDDDDIIIINSPEKKAEASAVDGVEKNIEKLRKNKVSVTKRTSLRNKKDDSCVIEIL